MHQEDSSTLTWPDIDALVTVCEVQSGIFLTTDQRGTRNGDVMLPSTDDFAEWTFNVPGSFEAWIYDAVKFDTDEQLRTRSMVFFQICSDAWHRSQCQRMQYARTGLCYVS